jgi:hypothetical protein
MPPVAQQFYRSHSSELSWVASVALCANLIGFIVVSYLPDIFGVTSRVVTVPYRAFMLGFTAYTVYKVLKFGRVRLQLSLTSILAIFFWSAYCTRFVVDAAVLQVPLGSPPSEMALYLFGAVLPAFIAFYLIRDIALYERALMWGFLGLGACCLYSMIRPKSDVELASTVVGSGANQILNHIGYGHMGLTSVILGLFVLLRIGGIRVRWYFRVLSGVVTCLGFYTIFAAGSHGALVAGAILIPAVIYLGLRQGSKLLAISACTLLVFIFSATKAYLSGNGLDVDRVLLSATAYGVENDSVNIRTNLYRYAWEQYLDNPLTGSSIVERGTLIYPHNLILEGFMATGTFGGVALVLLVLLASYRALRLIVREPKLAWLPLCFFQQLIGAMFSGGIYSNVLLFGMMGVVLGADIPARPRLTVREVAPQVLAQPL